MVLDRFRREASTAAARFATKWGGPNSICISHHVLPQRVVHRAP
jgi:hypothetical protein